MGDRGLAVGLFGPPLLQGVQPRLRQQAQGLLPAAELGGEGVLHRGQDRGQVLPVFPEGGLVGPLGELAAQAPVRRHQRAEGPGGIRPVRGGDGPGGGALHLCAAVGAEADGQVLGDGDGPAAAGTVDGHFHGGSPFRICVKSNIPQKRRSRQRPGPKSPAKNCGIFSRFIKSMAIAGEKSVVYYLHTAGKTFQNIK